MAYKITCHHTPGKPEETVEAGNCGDTDDQ